jgi:hypothetical protein
VARRTQNVDVIVDIPLTHVHTLFQQLQQEYYLNEQALDDAIRRRFPYNVIHLQTMVKVDLIPNRYRFFKILLAVGLAELCVSPASPFVVGFVLAKAPANLVVFPRSLREKQAMRKGGVAMPVTRSTDVMPRLLVREKEKNEHV